jgi:hypothetical protein
MIVQSWGGVLMTVMGPGRVHGGLFGRLKLDTIPKSLIRQPLLSISRFRWRGFGSCFRASTSIRDKSSRESRARI